MTDDVRASLEGWLDALYAWNERKNLTRVPREEAWVRHVLDSLAVEPFIGESVHVVDLGTGPGIPAWPLARVRPDIRVTAVDSNGKMLDFLRSVPLPNLTVVQGRAEDLPPSKADFVTGRAIAPLPIQLELSAGHVRKGGFVVPLRSLSDREIVPRCDLRPLGLELRAEEIVTIGGVERYLPVFVRTGPVAKGYPRHWSILRANPLGPTPSVDLPSAGGSAAGGSAAGESATDR